MVPLLSKNLVCLMRSGTVLIISSGRILVFNCSLKARYLFLQLKVSPSFFFVPKIVSRKQDMLPCISCLAGRSETGERFCCFRHFRSS